MAEWSLHIVNEKLLVLVADRNVPRDLCERMRAELRPTLAATGVECLVFWEVEVADHRDMPPEVTDAFRITDEWLRAHA